MGFSISTTEYTGGAQTFPVTFALGFLERDDVTAYVLGEVDGLGDQILLAFTWNSDAEILITDTLVVGQEVTLSRTVSKDVLEVDFTLPGTATREALTRNTMHTLMAVHEVLDGRLVGSIYTTSTILEQILAASEAAGDSALAAATSELAAGISEAATAADAVSTNADRVQTALDLVATSADAVATGLDAASSSADASSASADAVATGLDAASSSADASSAAASAASAALSSASAALFSALTRADVAALLVDTDLTYALGQTGSVVTGDTVRTRAEGFAYAVAASGAVDQDEVTAGGVKLYRVTAQNVEVTVGAGGDYVTVGEAIEFLDGQRRTYGNTATATIRLLTGFVMAEQIVASAIDLSWITITSIDAVVTVDVSGFVIVQRDSSDKYPIIAAVNNGYAPVLGCVIDATNVSADRIVGLYASSGGTVTVAPASGVKNCQYNAWAWAGKIVTLLPLSGLIWDDVLRPIFTGGTIGALTAWQGSHVSAVGWDMDDSKDAVICGGSSQMDAQRSRARNSTGDAAYLSRDLGIMNARTSDASGAAGNGYLVYHLGKINARHFDDTGYNGADNCGAWGFSALSGGSIEAEDATAMGCGAGSVKVEDNGQISVRGLRGEGGTDPAVLAKLGGRVSAEGAVVSGGAVNALRAELGGRIDAQGSTLTAVSSAVFAQSSGVVEVSSSFVTSTGDNALFAQDGGIIRGNDIVARGTVRAVLCRKAGEVWVPNSDLRKDGVSEQVTDVSIADAAIVNMYNSQGGVSTTINTLTSAGIIYR